MPLIRFLIAQSTMPTTATNSAPPSNVLGGILIIGGILALVAGLAYLLGKNRAMRREMHRCHKCDTHFDHGRFCPRCGAERMGEL